MVEVTYQMVLNTLQTAGLLIGIFYYLLTLRNQQKNQEISLKNQELTLQSQELSRKALEQAAETRQAQLLMQIYAHLREDKFNTQYAELRRKYEFRDYDDFMEKYGPEKNPEAYAKITKVLWLFTEMGTLVYRGHITTKDVRHLMSTNPVDAWRKWGPIIEGFRANVWNSRSGYRTFEYLAKTMMEEIESGVNEQFLDNLINATPDIDIN